MLFTKFFGDKFGKMLSLILISKSKENEKEKDAFHP